MFLLFEAPEGGLPSTPDGFVPKRAFNINLRKAFQVLDCRRLPLPAALAAPQHAADPLSGYLCILRASWPTVEQSTTTGGPVLIDESAVLDAQYT